MRDPAVAAYARGNRGQVAMILQSMLSHSPGFLFAMSALLLAAYGATRLLRACARLATRQRPQA